MHKNQKNNPTVIIEKYKMEEAGDYYVNPTYIQSILEETLSMSYNDILDYIKNAGVNFTFEQIQEYLNRKTQSRKKIEFETRNYAIPIKCTYTVEHLSSSTLNYFKNYISILKENCMDFLNLICQIQLNKEVPENRINQEFQDVLVKYDIKINANRDVFYQDMVRLLVPFIHNIISLKEKVEQANDLDTYLFFSVSNKSLKRDALTEDDLLPRRTIQLESLNAELDVDGYIPLTEKQRQKLYKKKNYNYVAVQELLEEIPIQK